MTDTPHVVTLYISPFIGEISHTGEALQRNLNAEELSFLEIPASLVLRKNLPSYKEALLEIKKVLERINNA